MTIPADMNQTAPTDITTWDIDPAASRVEFGARMRLMFLSNVTVVGRFSEVHGVITGTESDPTATQVSVTIGAASLDTRTPARDKHLRSADFFDVEHYPHLTFTSQRIEALDAQQGHYRVTGWLTIRDVAHDVSLDAWYTPQRGAEQRPTVSLTTVLDRRDFGLVWSSPIQKIANPVEIALFIELVPAASPA
jgi:polyisoprenoid-binding protein YceI